MLTTETGTQTRILAAAKTEFLEKGFRNASLRTIVKLAGVTTGAFYGYYDSKEKLFDALVSEQYEHVMDMYMSTQNSFKELEAFKKGYEQATGAWGRELPSLCKDTYDAVEKKFNDYFGKEEN